MMEVRVVECEQFLCRESLRANDLISGAVFASAEFFGYTTHVSRLNLDSKLD